MIEMRGVGVILLGSVLFGVMAVWVRVASEEMAPVAHARDHARLGAHPDRHRPLLGRRQLLLHYGLGFATATQGSLAAATSVLTASVFEALLLGERLGRRSVFGACLLVGAVVLAARRGTDRAVVDSPFAA